MSPQRTPDVLVLGTLGEARHRERRPRRAIRPRQRPGRGQLQRRRRRQTRRRSARSLDRAARRTRGSGDRTRCIDQAMPGHVVVPVATRGAARASSVERRRSPRRRRARAVTVASARQVDLDAHLEVDRDREDEALVVVGVLADEVDAPGSADDRTLPDEAWRRLSAHLAILRGSARGAMRDRLPGRGRRATMERQPGRSAPASRRFLTDAPTWHRGHHRRARHARASHAHRGRRWIQDDVLRAGRSSARSSAFFWPIVIGWWLVRRHREKQQSRGISRGPAPAEPAEARRG